jgi:hypothetical protein
MMQNVQARHSLTVHSHDQALPPVYSPTPRLKGRDLVILSPTLAMNLN